MRQKSEKIVLSISIMVSNSIDTIEKCMQSIEPILKEIPSELIIVDTGGTDGSIDIARNYADEVVRFTWCSDFAKARNAGLLKASGEWFLFMDDDEWFDNVEELIHFFKSGEYRQYHCASYVIRSYSDIRGFHWNDVRSVRIVERYEHTRFVSPIHEILTPIYFPEKVLDCFVHHYGYVYANDVERRKHGLRNISALLKVLKDTSDDYRLQVQLAQEYRAVYEYQMSEDVSLRNIAQVKDFEKLSYYDRKMLGWQVRNIVVLEECKQDFEQAYQYAASYMKCSWLNCITTNNLAYRLVMLTYRLKKYQECLQNVYIYEATYNRLKDDLQLRRQEVVLEQEDDLQERVLAEVFITAIRALQQMHKIREIAPYVEKLIKLESFDRNAKQVEELLQCMLLKDSKPYRKKLAKYLLKNETTAREIIKALESGRWEEAEQNALINIFASTGKEKAAEQYRLINDYRKFRGSRANNEIEKYLYSADNLLQCVHPIWKIVEELKLDIDSFIETKELYSWVEQVNNFAVGASAEKLDTILAVLQNVKHSTFKTDTLKLRCIERKMRLDKVAELSYEELTALGDEYSKLVYNIFQHFYREDAFQNEFLHYLPKECQFSAKLRKVLDTNQGELKKAALLKEAADVYPEMAVYCRTLVVKTKEVLSEQETAREEFQLLAEQVKKSIYGFIQQGAYGSAKATLEQLAVLVPEDEEVKRWLEIM